MTPCIDIFNHCLPSPYVEACQNSLHKPLAMFDRAVAVVGMCDPQERIQIMDAYPGYRQILSLASPAPEAIASSVDSPELAQIGNDALADWCQSWPNSFPGFVASLPMNNPEAAIAETRRAVMELGALGVQMYTHVNGQPLDRPSYLKIIECSAELNCPIWLHPLRPSIYADYPVESVSKFDLWWAFGWPHETSVCAGRLVFSGLFDRFPNLNIITHHGGGTIPMMEGRLDSGMESLGTCYAPEHVHAAETTLQEKPVEAFRRFYADTATFGSRIGIDAAIAFFGESKTLFATDFPFAGIAESMASVEGLGRELLFENAEKLLRLDLS